MPVFEIEQYELHAQTFRVKAKSAAEAIQKVFRGKAEAVDNSLALIEVCTDRGLPTTLVPELAEELRLLGTDVADGRIPSIRSIEEVE
jgi:hypothetical protein